LTWLQRSVDAGLLRFEGMSDLPRIAALVTKYADLPADFADVSLVWLAHKKRIDKIVTVDDRISPSTEATQANRLRTC
jgi:predicted nucleic acid-binding protein